MTRALLTACLTLALVPTLLPAANAPLPMPELVVPKTSHPPVIDGKMAPGEWNRAAAATGFTVAFAGDLAKNQSVFWVTYDDQFIYVCFKNYRGPHDDLLKKTARGDDDESIVFDHSNEIWITPPATPLATYQTLMNSYPAIYDCKKIPSVGYTSKSWRGDWTAVASETADYWIVEARAAIKSFGASAIADGATWRALFTTDVLGPSGGFRAWAPGGAFEEITRHGILHFKGEDAPVFQVLDVETLFTGKFQVPMALAAGAKADAKATVTLRFGGAPTAADGDLVLTKTVAAAAGKRETVSFEGDLAGTKLPTRKITVSETPREEKEVPSGFCEITAKTDDGTTLFHQVFPFVVDGAKRVPPARIRKTPYDMPFGVQAFYAPLHKKLIVKVDRYYLDVRAEAVAGTARLVRPSDGKVVAERPIAPFFHDYSEFPMDLATLDVPVQTEEDWKAAQPTVEENRKIAEENKKLKAEGKPELPLKDVPGVKPAEYKVEVVLAAKDGKELARTAAPARLISYQFEWLPNEVGLSDKVIPPWTPLKVKGDTVAMWNREYRLNGLGLAEKITNAGSPQLSGRMKLLAVVDGKEAEVRGGKPAVKKLTEAAADLEGAATLKDLAIGVATRVEFDGFVLNRMTVTPTKPTHLERLTLEIAMPKDEAPCFVTTSGGWSAYHGWTPAKWDSRETSSGSRVGNFVPYVLVTDSDRGISWFADTDQGWILDPAAPTQELVTGKDTVTLRIHFVTKPGLLEKPMTVEYGWMATPQKPQPPEWRGYHIDSHKPYYKSHCVFWNDADWAVLWPYYSSPYPWNMDKSRKALESSAANGVVGCVGNIGHAIARYRDYKDRWFNELAADWGDVLGNLSNGNVARSRGPNDFQVWHFDRWVKLGGLSGLYFDENYLGEDFNYLSGRAYLLPDERVQPAYSYLGLREFNKRLRYMFEADGKRPPNLWLHTTSGQPVYAWMPDVAMEGENVEPTSLENDYMECLPASRLRSIGMGRNLGAAPFIMGQANRHWIEGVSPLMVTQFVGWVLAHDCLPEGSAFWPVLASEMELWRDDTRFLPYWKTGLGVESQTPDVAASAHVWPGHAVLWIFNTAREDRQATLKLDLRKLGLDAAKTVAFDAETGEPCDLKGGKLSVAVPKRLWRAVRLVEPKGLTRGATFVATFDGGDAVADEAFGNRYPNTLPDGTLPRAAAEGKAGKGYAMDKPLTFGARHHVFADQGSVAYQVKLGPDSSGNLFAAARLKVSAAKDKFTVEFERREETGEGKAKKVQTRWEVLATAKREPAPAAWQELRIAWKGKDLKLSLGGKEVLAAALPEPFVPPMGRGREIQDNQLGTRPPTMTFGPVSGAAMDELVTAHQPGAN